MNFKTRLCARYCCGEVWVGNSTTTHPSVNHRVITRHETTTSTTQNRRMCLGKPRACRSSALWCDTPVNRAFGIVTNVGCLFLELQHHNKHTVVSTKSIRRWIFYYFFLPPAVCSVSFVGVCLSAPFAAKADFTNTPTESEWFTTRGQWITSGLSRGLFETKLSTYACEVDPTAFVKNTETPKHQKGQLH